MPSTQELAQDHRIATVPDPRALTARVRAEFREMPGLCLTLAQAARLFDLEPAQCERVLHMLVDAGDLDTDGRMFENPSADRPTP